MARISKSSIHAALQIAADHIIEAAGDDPFVSRKDIRAKVKTLQGTEAALTDIFYRFIDHRDAKKGARVTQKDVAAAMEYAKEKIIDKYDLNNNGLSKSEIAEMSTTGKLAVALARELKQAGGLEEIEDATAWKKELDEMLKGLLYFGPGSEADLAMEAVHLEAKANRITEDLIVKLLNLDLNNKKEIIYRLEARGELLTPSRTFSFDHDGAERAEKINAFAGRYLKSYHELIIGEDNYTSEHPYYLIGLTADGDIAGVLTQLIWT